MVADDRDMQGGGDVQEIQIDHGALCYYPATEEIPRETTERVFRYSYRSDALTRHGDSTRQVLYRWARRNGTKTFLLFVLHWDDRRDLVEVDRAVAAGEAGADHFDRALLCELCDVTCLDCATSRPLLVPEPSGLPGGTLPRRGSHTLQRGCPTCGHQRYPRYADVLG